MGSPICDEGRFQMGTKCLTCTPAPVALLCALLLVLVAVLLRLFASSRLPKSFFTRGKVIVGHTQLLVLTVAYTPDWPAAWLRAVSALRVFNINMIFDSVACFTNARWYLTYWLTLGTTLGTIILSITVRWIVARREWRAILASYSSTEQRERGYELLRTSRASFRWLVSLSIVSYLPVSVVLLQAFQCTERDDGSIVLRADPSVVCGGYLHLTHAVGSFMITITFVVGLPTALWYSLWRMQRVGDLAKETVSIRFGEFFEGFRSGLEYFEALSLIRKMVAVVVCVFFSENVKAGALLVTFVAYLVVLLILRPYKRRLDLMLPCCPGGGLRVDRDNFLEVLGASTLVFNGSVGLVLQIVRMNSHMSDNSALYWLAFTVLLLVNIGVFALMLIPYRPVEGSEGSRAIDWSKRYSNFTTNDLNSNLLQPHIYEPLADMTTGEYTQPHHDIFSPMDRFGDSAGHTRGYASARFENRAMSRTASVGGPGPNGEKGFVDGWTLLDLPQDRLDSKGYQFLLEIREALEALPKELQTTAVLKFSLGEKVESLTRAVSDQRYNLARQIHHDINEMHHKLSDALHIQRQMCGTDLTARAKLEVLIARSDAALSTDNGIPEQIQPLLTSAGADVSSNRDKTSSLRKSVTRRRNSCDYLHVGAEQQKLLDQLKVLENSMDAYETLAVQAGAWQIAEMMATERKGLKGEISRVSNDLLVSAAVGVSARESDVGVELDVTEQGLYAGHTAGIHRLVKVFEETRERMKEAGASGDFQLAEQLRNDAVGRLQELQEGIEEAIESAVATHHIKVAQALWRDRCQYHMQQEDIAFVETELQRFEKKRAKLLRERNMAVLTENHAAARQAQEEIYHLYSNFKTVCKTLVTTSAERGHYATCMALLDNEESVNSELELLRQGLEEYADQERRLSNA